MAPQWDSGCPTIAPSGGTFVTSALWGDRSGQLAMAVLKGQQIRMISLYPGCIDSGGAVITNLGRVRVAVESPFDRRLYVLTDANPGPIVQITPVLLTPSPSVLSFRIGPIGPDPQDRTVEGELGVEGGADRLGAAESVALALEGDVGNRDGPCAQGVDDHLATGRAGRPRRRGLGTRRADGRCARRGRSASGPRTPPGRRARADEAVEVAGLELVRVAGQRGEVGDAVAAGPGGEDVLEGQRGERREAAGRAAADAQPVAVDVTALGPGTGPRRRSRRRRRRPTARAAAHGRPGRSRSSRGG